MTPKQRLLTAINRGVPDRLPVTTHHVMPYFLNKYMGGMDALTFHQTMGFDPIVWTCPIKPDSSEGQYLDEATGILCSGDWRLETEEIPGQPYLTKRFRFITPRKSLTTVLQYNEYTLWQTEFLLKEKTDIDVIADFAPHPRCDVEAVNALAGSVKEEALVRGSFTGFAPFGQPGCWQDAACLYGIENLILEAFDDPQWVSYTCEVLRRMKETFIRSTKGARFDILELGGGDASTTVISPELFRRFVAPHDQQLVRLAHGRGAEGGLSYLRRHDANPGGYRGSERGRHGDLHPARHGG